MRYKYYISILYFYEIIYFKYGFLYSFLCNNIKHISSGNIIT
nr:MAG TPA: hypothetical protein [Caudoviricetes sp.]